MKSLLLLILIQLSIPALATDENCDEQTPLTQAAGELALPNCIRSRIRAEACRDCGSNFLRRYPGRAPQLSLQETQEKFLKSALEEYRKSVSHNLLEAAKLATLPNTGSSLEQSRRSCQIKGPQDFMNGCGSEAATRLLRESPLLRDITRETANELARILATDPNVRPEPTLLTRNTPACFVPERHILYLQSSALEEMFSPALIRAFQNVPPNRYSSMEEFFLSPEFSRNYQGDISELRNNLKVHPLLNTAFSTPAQAIGFLSSIRAPQSPARLREALYNRTAGDRLDRQLAENCEKSFTAIKRALCSENFESGKLDLDPGTNFTRLTASELPQSEEELAASEELITGNLQFLRLCPRVPDAAATSLTRENQEIGMGLDPEQRELPYDTFRSHRHRKDIGGLQNLLCGMTEQTCTAGTFNCRIFRKLQQLRNPNSPEARLANSTNDSARELLRSMVGDATGVDPKGREVLIANGLLTRRDGSYVELPQVQERHPEYLARVASEEHDAPNSSGADRTAETRSERETAQRDNPRDRERAPASQATFLPPSNEASPVASAAAARTNTEPDLNGVVNDPEDLRKVQDELRRRLGALPPGQPPSTIEARQVVRDAFSAQNQPLTPAQEVNLADQIRGPRTETPVTRSVLNDLPGTGRNPAGISDTPTQLQDWRNKEMNRALLGMAGARGQSPTDTARAANAAQGAELTRVALNIGEDSRVTLAEILNSKISGNDPETQLLKVLLRNNNNFVLQVRSMNFRIQFNPAQGFNLLLESGDQREAERIRPQLESFLRRLRA